MIEGHGDDAYQYPGDIRADFSSNICPHADHSALTAHLAGRLPALLAHYPEPEAWSLERLLAERHGIAPECVVATSGATDAIYLVAQTFRLKPVIARPTFSEYADACRQFPAADARRTACWLCTPNNPTGSVAGQEAIEQLSRRHDLLVLDQSYEHYTDAYVCPPRQAARLGNVVQLHSMTKTYAVPGLRLGYITAPARLARQVRRRLRPWAVSAVAVEAGLFLLRHHEQLCVRPDLAEAQRLARRLAAVGGIEVMPTATSFMLCRLCADGPAPTAAQLKDHLARQHGLLIRDASNFRGLTPWHFRVAAQTAAANDALVAAINRFLHG